MLLNSKSEAADGAYSHIRSQLNPMSEAASAYPKNLATNLRCVQEKVSGQAGRHMQMIKQRAGGERFRQELAA